MNHLYLNNHSFSCETSSKNNQESDDPWLRSFSMLCASTTEHFLFYAMNEFYLIEHHRCKNFCYEEKARIVTQCLQSPRHKQKCNAQNAMTFDREFKRNRASLLTKNVAVDQVHYLYANNAGKEYCISSRVKYVDTMFNNDLMQRNATKAKEYIKDKFDRGYAETLCKDIDRLTRSNYCHFDEITVLKSIDELTSNINKQIKQL